jgi:hypothetical protein
VGSIAAGGLAIGFIYAIGGLAIGPAVADGARCDAAVRDFILRWLGSGRLPRPCL